MQTYTLEQSRAWQLLLAPQPAATPRVPSNVVQLAGGIPSVFASRSDLIDMNAAAQASMPSQGFESLPAERMNAMLAAMLALPAIVSRADVSRNDGWLSGIFGLADAARLGATDAYALALNWSKTSPRFNEANFIKTWNSFDPGRPDRATIGTVIGWARDVGFDLREWFYDWAPSPANSEAAQWPELPPDLRRIEATPTRMNEADALREMNSRFAYVHRAGEEGAILYFGPNKVELRTLKDLRDGLANRTVFTKKTDRKGVEHSSSTPAIDWWHKHPGRRTYERTAFRPHRPYAPDGAPLPGPIVTGEFNLWSGFTLQPRRNSWRLLRRHLWAVICRKDQLAFKYTMKWLAHLVQHPNKSPGVVVILKSNREGTGKTTLGEAICRMVGVTHSTTLRTPEELLGEFNAHLAFSVFVLLDEVAFPGEHAQARKLKAQITADTWKINEKYKRSYDTPNIAHLLMTTNASWAVGAGNKARRFFVLDVDDRYAGNRAYFTRLRAEMDAGGVDGLLDTLNRIDLRSWHPQHDMPRTMALREQQMLSAGVCPRWAMDAVLNGGFAVERPSALMELSKAVWSQAHSSNVLTRAVQHFARAAGSKEPITSVIVGRWLGRCKFTRRRSNGETLWDIPDQTAFHAAVMTEAGI